MNNYNICPICGSSSTEERVSMERQSYKNTVSDVELYVRHCHSCESEYAGFEETKKNKRAMLAHKRRVDELMSSKRIAKIRSDMNLTIEQAGKVFGGGPIAFWKYENDEVLQSVPMDKLLRIAERSPDACKILLMEAGLSHLIKEGSSTVHPIETTVAMDLDEFDPSQYEYNPKVYREESSMETKNAK